jgi:hypothetical protein
MPRHTVDTSQIQPATGLPVSPKHPSIPDMPYARGSVKAGVPVQTNDATPPDVVAGVSREQTKHPAIQEHRIPASSQHQEPPAKVTSSNTSLEPSA